VSTLNPLPSKVEVMVFILFLRTIELFLDKSEAVHPVILPFLSNVKFVLKESNSFTELSKVAEVEVTLYLPAVSGVGVIPLGNPYTVMLLKYLVAL
jgi:hypothetical protein